MSGKYTLERGHSVAFVPYVTIVFFSFRVRFSFSRQRDAADLDGTAHLDEEEEEEEEEGTGRGFVKPLSILYIFPPTLLLLLRRLFLLY